MKKLVVLLIAILLVTGCGNNKVQTPVITDAEKFKAEYEKLNDSNVSVSIDKNNPIVYVNEQEAIDIIKNKTGIIYFGFANCPWCRNAIPVLLEALKEKNINTLYYLDISIIRDKAAFDDEGNYLTNEDGSIKYDDKGTEGYRQIVSLLEEYLDDYGTLGTLGIKRLYAPDVFFIKDGKVIGNHSGTLDSQTDSKTPLTSEQRGELKNIYLDLISKTYKFESCDEKC